VQIVRRDGAGAVMMSLLSVNLADRAGTTSILGLGFLGVLSSAMGLRGLGARYFERARLEGRRRPVSREFLFELLFDAMNFAGAGDLRSALATLTESVAAARRTGSRSALAQHLSLLSILEAMAGRLNSAAEISAESAEVTGSHSSHARFHVLASYVFYAALRLPGAEGLERYRALEPMLLDSMEPGDVQAESTWFSTKAIILCRGGAWAEADSANDRSFDLLVKNVRTTPAAHWTSIQGAPDVYVGLWEHTKAEGGDVSPIRTKTLRAVKCLAGFAKRYPVYGARLVIVRGQVAALDGQRDKAAQLFRDGAAAAGRLQLRFDEALAYFELARLSAARSSERDKHLAVARAIFTECGAQHELDRIAALEG